MGGPWCLWITKSWLGRDKTQPWKAPESETKQMMTPVYTLAIITQGKFYKNSF